MIEVPDYSLNSRTVLNLSCSNRHVIRAWSDCSLIGQLLVFDNAHAMLFLRSYPRAFTLKIKAVL
jgi:hypothetical protein